MRLCRLFAIFLFPATLFGQNLSLPLGNDAYYLADRLKILSDSASGFHSAIKPWLRSDIVDFGLGNWHERPGDWQIQYLFDENNEFIYGYQGDSAAQRKYVDSTRTFYIEETAIDSQENPYTESRKPILKYFYKTPANLFQVDTRDFYLRVNPLLDLRIGTESNEESTIFYNRRGIALRGGIGHKVYFSTRIIENQARFANYVNEFVDQFRAVPGAGLYKNYNSSLFDIMQARDFIQADGYVGFDLIPQIGMQLGHGHHFLGDGVRSLILSDFGPEMFYLKFNTRVWKLHYQNIFAELASEGIFDQPSSTIVGKKYLAAHYLSFQLRPNLEFGLYEAIISSREKGGIELQYLNPIIFYRSIEHNLGSPDNAVMGLTGRWDIFQRISIYGQFLLDDLKVSEILDGNVGWWGNKFGGQLGLKYINAFSLHGFDLQVEINHVRPYTYSHRDSSSSYTHFNQALAHPLGANFKEYIFKGRYHPVKKFRAEAWLSIVDSGEDEGEINYGSNIVRPNNMRPGNFDMETGQGIPVTISTFSLNLGYQLKHNLWFDLRYFNRVKNGPSSEYELKTAYILAGLRLNLAANELFF